MTSPKKIKTIGDRCLRVTSEEVVFDKKEIAELYTDMCDAMWEADGIGLAAPQIGINKRVILVDETTEEHGRYAHLMVNPKITWKSEEKVLFDEGCLSVPDTNGEVSRSKSIKITFQNKDGKYKKWKLDGIAARVVQHEIDHLEGILFVDYLDAKQN
jgi:peptide deformylase|tara:strand:- start:774 stop:1244 length:471 start_codon:yes stop_codon:yes gene_type:complete